jgi:hypothetical protein
VGYLQQKRVLGQDAEEMHQIASEPAAAAAPAAPAVKNTAKSKGRKKETAKVEGDRIEGEKKVVAPGVTVSIRTAGASAKKSSSRTSKPKTRKGARKRRKK